MSTATLPAATLDPGVESSERGKIVVKGKWSTPSFASLCIWFQQHTYQRYVPKPMHVVIKARGQSKTYSRGSPKLSASIHN